MALRSFAFFVMPMSGFNARIKDALGVLQLSTWRTLALPLTTKTHHFVGSLKLLYRVEEEELAQIMVAGVNGSLYTISPQRHLTEYSSLALGKAQEKDFDRSAPDARRDFRICNHGPVAEAEGLLDSANPPCGSGKSSSQES